MESLLQGAMYEVADHAPGATSDGKAGASGLRKLVVLDEDGVVQGTGARIVEGDEVEQIKGTVGDDDSEIAAEVR
jgi:hypothetical protein